ncbi:MAG TPA: tetratricopeptide repeat protein [Rariglobus sp.]|jgi:tetratricopeptide (TPR) repeat protein|nr:tetratricopeptide repeat protein [Rariglobus sp.]
MKFLLSGILIACLAGCAGSAGNANFKPSTRHAIAGDAAKLKKDWPTVRTEYAAAVVCAEQEGRAPATLADMYFEYGLSLAVLGEFTDAETYFLKTLEIDKKTNGPIEVDLTQLARINFDQRKYKEAVAYYDDLLLILTKIKVDSARPASFMVILSEYSMCLTGLGRSEDAKAVDALMVRLQAENQYTEEPIKKRIPYGTPTVGLPLPSHKFETAEPEPAAAPVNLNIYIADPSERKKHPILNAVAAQILIEIISRGRANVMVIPIGGY